MKINTILVSQPTPPEKSPYYDLERKFGVKLTFKQFIRIESLSAKEFRTQKIFVPDFTAVVFTSRTSVDHFFNLCKELRAPISEDLQCFCLSETIALYLQKYITYRKRKIHFPKVAQMDELALVMKKHNTERFLMPVADVHKEDMTIFTKAKVNVTTAIFYRTVSTDFTPEEITGLLDLAARLKAEKKNGTPHKLCEGKNVALIFEKTSTRKAQAAALKAENEGKTTADWTPEPEDDGGNGGETTEP